jgi:hypothetical protein
MPRVNQEARLRGITASRAEPLTGGQLLSTTY